MIVSQDEKTLIGSALAQHPTFTRVGLCGKSHMAMSDSVTALILSALTIVSIKAKCIVRKLLT